MEIGKYIAMVLAGGRGERLGALTRYYSKPAVCFGGNHRIIDFTLSNCKNSKIDASGILSQYFNADLNGYINSFYGGETGSRGIYLLSSKNESGLYKGTADAVCKNLPFIERFSPESVLILASDHVYRMDYGNLIEFHRAKDADVTIASVPVPIDEAPKFGIIRADKNGRVLEFEEKPNYPKSNLASMGIYVFKWSALKKYLCEDSLLEDSQHDFGNDIIPAAILRGKPYTYRFNGYWRDVGTIHKLWEASMDQLNNPALQIQDEERRAYDTLGKNISGCISEKSIIKNSILSEGCCIYGHVKHSVLSQHVTVGVGSEIVNSVVMPNSYIGNNVKIINTIVGNHAIIRDGAVIGENHGMDCFIDLSVCAGDASLISPWADISAGMVIKRNSHVVKEKLENYYLSTQERPEFYSEMHKYAISG